MRATWLEPGERPTGPARGTHPAADAEPAQPALAARVGVSDKPLCNFEQTRHCTLDTFVRACWTYTPQALARQLDLSPLRLPLRLPAYPPYDLTYCPGYQGEHFMDMAGEGQAPARAHVLAAAQQTGLPANVAARALDEVLEHLTPDVFTHMAKDLPLRAATQVMVHRAMTGNHGRLARG